MLGLAGTLRHQMTAWVVACGLKKTSVRAPPTTFWWRLRSICIIKRSWCIPIAKAQPTSFPSAVPSHALSRFIGRFASHYNAQIVRFNSKYACPGSCGVDSFSQDWRDDNNWLCPPVNSVVACVRHLAASRGCGILIVPEWRSAYFWPFLSASSSAFKSFVHGIFVLPKIGDQVLEGPGQRATYKRNASVFTGCPGFNMLALRLDFR